ncbi:MAG: hypothetical protein ACYC27_01405 [Armatimonadota bacterium]
MKAFVLSSLVAGVLLMNSMSAVHAGKILLLNENFPNSSERVYSELKQGITDSGIPFEEIDGNRLVGLLESETGNGNILVMPNAAYLPVAAKPSLLNFLKSGNHLMAISGPAFYNMVVKSNGNWVTREKAKSDSANTTGEPIINFATQNMTDWARATGTPQNTTEYSVEKSGRGDIPDALHVKISKLVNWDTLGKDVSAQPFPSGYSGTSFWAKGGPNTPELLIEWKEKDGTRWMGTVKLTTEWKRYVLTPEDFRFWADGSAPNRGKAGDIFKPENASFVAIGLSDGLTNQKLGIAHEYWVSDVRAVKDVFGGMDFTQPMLESLSPIYKTYPTKASEIRFFGSSDKINVDSPVITSLQRSFGYGSNAVRKTRQIPLMYAYDRNGERRGIAGHLFVNTQGAYAGSIWGYIGLEQADIEKNSGKIIPLIVSALKQMNNGVYLANAGSEFFGYASGESVKYGAYITNLSDESINGKIEFKLTSKGSVIHSSTADINIPARTITKPLNVMFNAGVVPDGPCTLNTVLTVNGRTVDTISHDFQVIKYGKLTKQNTVTIQNGDFVLNGKKWYGLGMNYWPRYSVGQEPSDYWLHWLSPEQYDPEMIEEDLRLAKKLKMNLLSIQYGNLDQARPLMDFLERAKKYGIKVHSFMPGLHPLSHDFKTANPMIKAAHLGEAPAFFAYDLGWEVNVGPYSARKNFDKSWQEWVIDRYGSIDAAVKDWNYKPEVVDGFLTGPADQQLVKDGEWRVFVAAYRRFMDDLISKGYKSVKENVRSMDKMHLLGARSGYGGTGAIWIADRMPFDLLSGAKHLDYISPEAYNIGGDRKGFMIGGFHGIYGRYFSGNKPIYWAEYGSPLFFNLEPLQFKNEYTAEQYERERAYYEGIIRMTQDTYANGSAGWWWPGGLRVDEKSDFGIINPDGTPRPAAVEISKLADNFYKPRVIPTPNTFLTVDRDKYTSGYAGVFEEFGKRYVDILDSGKIPGVKTAGTGTTSADTPLIAVGNVKFNGKNPLKYLNAEFNWIKVNGKLAADDSVIAVEKGKPVYIDASIGNTADAKWLSPKSKSKGAVYMIVSAGGKEINAPITADTAFLQDASVKKYKLSNGITAKTVYEFRMLAEGRGEFGEVFRITLDPK